MIKNLAHAAIGVALIFTVGWLLNQPSLQRSMAHHKGAHDAVVGILATLALFVLVCLWRAFKKAGKPASSSRTTPYAVPAKRGR